MSLERDKLEQFLIEYLSINDFNDYGPNGLQIEGDAEISRIAFSVSACEESIQQAVELKAQALIVHHGLFWSFHGPRTLTGAFGRRVRPLVQNKINLFGFHLPLDAHPEVGNAATLGKLLDMQELEPFGDYKGMPLGIKAKWETPMAIDEVASMLQPILHHPVIVARPNQKTEIQSLGIITGGASDGWQAAKQEGLDAYLTGEIKEHDYHDAKENEIVMFAGGHHATEQFGIQNLKEKIASQFPDSALDLIYIPIDNPA